MAWSGGSRKICFQEIVFLFARCMLKRRSILSFKVEYKVRWNPWFSDLRRFARHRAGVARDGSGKDDKGGYQMSKKLDGGRMRLNSKQAASVLKSYSLRPATIKIILHDFQGSKMESMN
ncbi:hypothetical protein FRX31_013609 [Thalictrum thalictroides]|uniref:Uncharacterized protein n=1 Tax=Thalictrum thalictroides TaxID=46969 RepID=A0A7J6WH85_THATH|nr:hypothetical protein FRX31_013609 [Thalictrum thalictroides]